MICIYDVCIMLPKVFAWVVYRKCEPLMLTTGLSLVSLAATTWLQKACQSARVTFSSPGVFKG